MNSPIDTGTMPGVADLRRKLEELRSEHRDLDDVIARMSEAAPFNQLQIQRLKKRKLMLKDQITQLESKLLPDIIA
ncbi:MAG: YdcH family protein [Dongiaceae bacterium]